MSFYDPISDFSSSFVSIWRDIDDGRLDKLSINPDLPILLNDKHRGMTPLYLAVKLKRIDMVIFLLQTGADPNIVCRGMTCLWLASFHGILEIIMPLIQAGADPNVVCSGATALHVAAARGLIEICEVLCNMGANLNIATERLGTPLHVAVRHDHRYVLTCFLAHNPDLNLSNGFGETVLHLACSLYDPTVIRMLLNSGLPVDPFVKDKVNGSTAAHLTVNGNIFKLLVAKWPELLLSTDYQGRTASFFIPGDRFRVLSAISEKFVLKSQKDRFHWKDKYSDLTLICPTGNPEQATESILCHRSMLYIRSPYFATKLSHLLNGASPSHEAPIENHTTLEIPEVNANIMKLVLFYIYTDRISYGSDSQLQDLEMAATLFEMQSYKLLIKYKKNDPNVLEPPPSTYIADMKGLLTKGYFGDLQISYGSGTTLKRIFGHKFILCHLSEFFSTMLQSGYSEAVTSKVTLNQPAAYLDIYFNWAYSFALPSLKNQHEQLLQVSSSLVSPTLELVIQTLIIEQIDNKTTDEIARLVQLAERLNYPILFESCALLAIVKSHIRSRLLRDLEHDVLERFNNLLTDPESTNQSKKVHRS